MGTPSLLAVETKQDKYYAQKLSIDGNPTEKGKEYYETILKSLMEAPYHFIINNKPNRNFFTRIKHFLNNAQYASHRSFNANQIINAEKWDDYNLWQYLFNKNGDFIFSYNSSNYFYTIPWKFTLNLTTHFWSHEINKETLTPFWKFLENWDGITDPPTLNLTTCETLAFPKQDSSGWRKSGTLTVMKNKINTMFYHIQRKRNKQFTKSVYNSEYLDVKRCPLKELPLLISTLKREEAINLLERRLKNARFSEQGDGVADVLKDLSLENCHHTSQ